MAFAPLMRAVTLALLAANCDAFATPARRPPRRAAATMALPGRLVGRASALALRGGGAVGVGAATALALRGGGGAVGVGGPLSLLPPVATLAVALGTKQVAVALLVGIWSGCLLLHSRNPAVALLRAVDMHVLDAVVDKEHATVILFNLLLGGTIGVVQKGGGAQGLARSLKRFAKDAKSCLATACGLAGLIFFDDYASILIVGNSFRPLVPALRVCREKFAALLHFVAVSVSASSPVSSWIGQQVGMVSAATAAVPPGAIPSAFVLTVRTLPYRLFPLALLAFVAANVASDRDFGPMRDAVARNEAAPAPGAAAAPDGGAALTLALEPAGTPLRAPTPWCPLAPSSRRRSAAWSSTAAPLRAADPAAPAGVLAALSAGDSVLALLWGSLLGATSSVGLLLAQKILSLDVAVATFIEGMKDVVEPVIVLALAWALGGIIGAAGTADFIAGALLAGGLPAWALPASSSLLAYVISFATGSSFGTMGILFPLIGPLAWRLGGGDVAMLTHCFGALLGGSLFGNVFSPIADTTILTQLATRVPLADHVKTAGPYALLVGALCVVLGDVPVGLGLFGPLPALALIVAAQTAVLAAVGRKPPSAGKGK
ncbi:Na+/H+ antiporter [Aureococcus anophagefferens]|nr:Na+/H+ antiporter [Aureococcus anophagefferens]